MVLLALLLLRCLFREEATGLARPKIGVKTALRQQLAVATLLDDAPLVHDNQSVHGSDGGEPMRDGNDSLNFHQIVELLLDSCLDLRVERAGRLVEDENGRILQEDARNGDPLALTAGKFHARSPTWAA